MADEPRLTEIRLSKDRKTLTISFDDGNTYDLAAEYLRVTSPSAEVQGHSAEQRKTVGGKANVTILDLEPVGNYAIKIRFDDQHDTGIFSWTYLARLGREREEIWGQYLSELEEKGLSRASA